mmetsp:Transcript_53/g.55  ORF Transcript_53/g.55 Transcript_53/m.55 type:complete len:103 (-) Transcript_53:668-976(-)
MAALKVSLPSVGKKISVLQQQEYLQRGEQEKFKQYVKQRRHDEIRKIAKVNNKIRDLWKEQRDVDFEGLCEKMRAGKMMEKSDSQYSEMLYQSQDASKNKFF